MDHPFSDDLFEFTAIFKAIPAHESGCQFETLINAETEAYTHARVFGYAIAIKRTNKNRHGEIKSKLAVVRLSR